MRLSACGFGAELALRKVQAQIELQLVILRRHVRTQLVERLVVLAFPQVRQFMHDDHSQLARERYPQEVRDIKFVTALIGSVDHVGSYCLREFSPFLP